MCICEAIKQTGEPCAYEWEPNVSNFPPTICPRCKSPHWNGKANKGRSVRHNPNRPGYLYVIKTADGLFYKIGFGVNVWDRWTAHQNGLPRRWRGELLFLGYKPSTPFEDTDVRARMGNENRADSPYCDHSTHDWFRVNEHTSSIVKSLGDLLPLSKAVTKPTKLQRGIDKRFTKKHSKLER